MAPVTVWSPDLCVAAGLRQASGTGGCMAVKLSLAGTGNVFLKVNAASVTQVCVHVCAQQWQVCHLFAFTSLSLSYPEKQPLKTEAGHIWQSQSESGYACGCLQGEGRVGAVTLATQLHILQRLPQRKNVFLQHAITTDYRLPSLHQKLSLEKKKQYICVCVCVS